MQYHGVPAGWRYLLFENGSGNSNGWCGERARYGSYAPTFMGIKGRGGGGWSHQITLMASIPLQPAWSRCAEEEGRR